MKFLCVKCDAAMEFEQKEDPRDGTLSIRFKCPSCAHTIAMLTNPGETQFVRSLGVQIGHEQIAESPMSMIRNELVDARVGAFVDGRSEPVWTEAALRRLSAAPAFVQPMVQKLYSDYARSKGYAEITPAVMNEAREAPQVETIVVTISSHVAHLVVRKSVALAKETGTHLVGVIENMAGYVCPHCGEIGPLFTNDGGSQEIAQALDIPFLGSVPFDYRLAEAADRGIPFVLEHPDTVAGRAILQIAQTINAEG